MKYTTYILSLLIVLGIIINASYDAIGQDVTVSKELLFLSKNISQTNFEAKIEFEKKKYKEAAKKYLEILHHKPNDITTLYNLARCYAYLRKPIQAAEALQFALDAGLNDIQTLLSDSTWIPHKNNEKIRQVLNNAQKIQKERGESFFVECKVAIKCRVRQPNNYDSTKAYPLIVILHGNGGNAESYMAVRDIMDASNFFFAAPQGPYQRKLLELNSPAYSWFLLTNDKKLWEKADPFAIEYIISVIDDIKTQYKISEVYLIGHSQGGALAYMTGIKTSNLINGIICFGARNPIEMLSAAEIYNAELKIPIFIGHGTIDPQVNINEAKEAQRILTKYGYNVTLKSFNGGHWLDTSTLIEAKKWIEGIKSKSKKEKS
ncbi:MAG: alpha/beta fold hydrolase [Bacteroidales bacterium]|nr:MAG: alpha/beta fold hydrolase [Bacteroidales bacterium]